MKILTVSNMYPSADCPTYGTFVYNFVRRLEGLNPDATIDVVAIRGKRKSYVAKARAYVTFYRQLLGALLKGDYDLIYVHTITFPIIPLRLALLFKRLPLVFNVHGDDVLPSNSLKRTLKRLARPVVKKARMIVTPSSYFSEVVKREFPGVTDEQLFVSPSGGIAPHFFVKHAPRRPGRPLLLGFVSRIDAGKGWDMFIEAISAIRARGIDVRGIMAGRGSQVEQMKKLISKKGIEEYIDYRGPVPQDRLPILYSSIDLFIFPTSREAESLGLVGLEAMAAGTPVVACNMAGPATYVVDGVNGYLFEPGNINALIDKILIYNRRSDETRDRLSKCAVDTAARYEASAVARELSARLMSLFK